MEELTEYDRLVEQQDQEIAQYGGVSPFTQAQLDALANGTPIPQINDSAVVRRPRSHDDDDLIWFDK